MILFGGNRGFVMSGTIYILDVISMTWTQGRDTQPREGAACSVSGDYFIAWGGTTVQLSFGHILPKRTLHDYYFFVLFVNVFVFALHFCICTL